MRRCAVDAWTREMTRIEFVEAALMFCELTGGSVTSWKRTIAHNTKVGSTAVNSPHLYGLGVDVVYDAPVLKAVAVERARRLGLKLLRESDHDHLQPLDWAAG